MELLELERLVELDELSELGCARVDELLSDVELLDDEFEDGLELLEVSDWNVEDELDDCDERDVLLDDEVTD